MGTTRPPPNEDALHKRPRGRHPIKHNRLWKHCQYYADPEPDAYSVLLTNGNQFGATVLLDLFQGMETKSDETYHSARTGRRSTQSYSPEAFYRKGKRL